MTALDEAGRLSLAEAVTATGTSESTIRRRLRERAFPGAVRDSRGGWRLPIADLRAAGFTVAGPLVEVPPTAEPAVEVDERSAPVAVEDVPAAKREALRRAKRRRAASIQRDQEVVDLRARADRAEATAAARVDELVDMPRLRQENADLRERVGRAEATAEARGVEVERLLHVVDRLTRAVGGVSDGDDGPRVMPAIVDLHDGAEHDATRTAEEPGSTPVYSVVEDAPEPMLRGGADQPSARRRGLLSWLLGRH